MKKLVLALAVLSMAVTTANAQITWSEPIAAGTKFSDIITGDLVFTLEPQEYPGSTSGTADFFTGSGASTFNNGLNTVLNSHGWNSAGADVVVDGLTVGNDYQIQLLMGDTRDCCLERTQTASDGTNVSGEFSRDAGSVVGSFTADADSISINIAGASDPGLSGYILWDATTSTPRGVNFGDVAVSIPEPSSVLLSAAGLLGCLALRRRR